MVGFASPSEYGPLMFTRRISLRISERVFIWCLYVSARFAARECRWARRRMFSVWVFRWVRLFVRLASAVIRVVVVGRLGVWVVMESVRVVRAVSRVVREVRRVVSMVFCGLSGWGLVECSFANDQANWQEVSMEELVGMC